MNQERNLAEIQKEYAGDHFATNAACVVTYAGSDKVVCEMPIGPGHLNAHGAVMGGAIFTLADFAFAIACNYAGVPSVAVECNIRYYAATKGTKLIATAKADREGRTLGHYTVEIIDDLGKKIAGYTAVAFHHNQ